MSRFAEAIHVIEKNIDGTNFRRVEGSIWETAYWIVSDSTAKSLIGGTVYVHKGQNLPAHAGGEIIDIYHEPDTKANLRVVRFKSDPSAKGVIAEHKGWGNERKIDWRSEDQLKLEVANDDDESAFPEGKEKYALHRSRERDSALTRKVKQKRLSETGKLECEVCSFDFIDSYGQLGNGFIEAHHRVPVSQLDGKTKTKSSDIALVCSNCHRMLHRGKTLQTVENLRDTVNGLKID
jgi:hypothetical protein